MNRGLGNKLRVRRAEQLSQLGNYTLTPVHEIYCIVSSKYHKVVFIKCEV